MSPAAATLMCYRFHFGALFCASQEPCCACLLSEDILLLMSIGESFPSCWEVRRRHEEVFCAGLSESANKLGGRCHEGGSRLLM